MNRQRIILQEPEQCLECNEIFLSAHVLWECEDHQGKRPLGVGFSAPMDETDLEEED